jgi:membrane protein implicated in regulation of membrane protease activity
MILIMILIEIPMNALLKYISEPEAILIFAVLLVIATVGIRWFLKKYEETDEKVKGKG